MVRNFYLRLPLSLGVLQGGCFVETVVAPQHCPVPGSLRCPCSTLYGIGVDAERRCTTVRPTLPASESAATRMFPSSSLPSDIHSYAASAPRYLPRITVLTFSRRYPRGSQRSMYFQRFPSEYDLFTSSSSVVSSRTTS